MIDASVAEKCRNAAKEMRIDAIRAMYAGGKTGTHIGGTLSAMDIMAALYVGVMNISKEKLQSDDRDRFILSKGHCSLAQYAALKQIGAITDEELMTFKQSGTRLYAHSTRDRDIGVEFSTGSLGQGICLAVGVAMALKKKGNPARVFVLLGDGECNEGSVWEALASASHFKLDNLTVIVDRNRLQHDGFTEEILSMGDLAEKISAFGLDTKTVDGHDMEALLTALEYRSEKPVAIVADTVKGKGVSFMENSPSWHSGRLNESQFNTAIAEMEGA